MEKSEFNANSKIPKKGTLSKALLVGARNKILIAFDCRQIKKKLEVTRHVTQTSPMMMTDLSQIRLRVFTVSLGESDGGGERVLPSLLLSDKIWVRFIVDLLDLENLNVMAMIPEQQRIKTKHLIKILQDSF